MPKINILDKSVYNLIAAGEVIDKPASVVKELIENSIDAGATSIVVEIKNGGIDYIKVSDDGCGISQEDMHIAFLPHTTSKIKTAEDLYNIGTLGFRGEALSTITAVSKVTMISKTREADFGNIIQIDGGEIKKEEPIGCSDGTTVISEDLFYNIPARRKFLKKAKQEESEITNIITRVILSHPEISIEYIANDKVIYKSNGNGLFDAIYSIYGKEVVDNLIQVNISKNGLNLTGYIGKVNYTKPNRTYQTLIVNGRYVINQTISTAIYKAYENYMMKNNFPFFVLSLNLDNDKVDVNVHPNKLDIKFSNSNEIFEFVLVEISKLLIDSINVTNLVLTNNEKEEKKVDLDLSNLQVLDKNEGINYKPNAEYEVKEIEISGDVTNKQSESVINDFSVSSTSFDLKNNDWLTLKSPSQVEIGMLISKGNKDQVIEQDQEVIIQEKASFKENYKVIGVLFDTYIIVQFKDYIYLIDQHAGHERILFDKFMEQCDREERVVQPLLIPYVLKVNNVENAYIADNLSILKDLGFEIDEFGDNCYKIASVPVIMKNLQLKSFFDEILADLSNPRANFNKSEIIRDYIAKTACKNAIKAYDKLDDSQIEYLLNLLDDTKILLCPHGRQIILKITEKEIEKWFKRIV